MLYINIVLYLCFVLYEISNVYSFMNPSYFNSRKQLHIFTSEDKNTYNICSKKYYQKLNMEKNKSDKNIPQKKFKKLNNNDYDDDKNEDEDKDENENENEDENEDELPKLRIFLPKSSFLKSLGIELENDNEEKTGYFDEDEKTGRRRYIKKF